MAYFDRSGEASDEAGRWANFSELPALELVPGIAFQPITTDSVMTNFVTFEPNAVADVHRHSEQQIAIVIERGRGRTRGVVGPGPLQLAKAPRSTSAPVRATRPHTLCDVVYPFIGHYSDWEPSSLPWGASSIFRC